MNRKALLFYAATLLGALLLGAFVVYSGPQMPAQESTAAAQLEVSGGESTLESFATLALASAQQPLPRLLLQMVVIVFVARLSGSIFRRAGQPAVIGEVLAGIALGPTLFGLIAPEWQQMLFAPAGLDVLALLSQLGLILFLFVIGMEIDPSLLKKRASAAVVVSHASIVLPFVLGMTLALTLYDRYAPDGVAFLSFALFLGIAMSITAFPVLARILQERNLGQSRVGAIALAASAADDVTAWCILSIVVAMVRASNPVVGLSTAALAVFFVLFMFFAVRPALRRLGEVYASRERLRGGALSLLLLAPLGSALATEWIGVHALFGAFLAGVMMPAQSELRRLLSEKLRDFSVVLLLPLFFALSGLRTDLALLFEPSSWLAFGLITGVAILGKLGGAAIAARVMGESWRDSLILGFLMNTRGLMELIVLAIGLELGVLSPPLFTLMVMMALLTTFMTGPALNLIDRLLPEAPPSPSRGAAAAAGGALLAFARRDTADAMLGLFEALGWDRGLRGLHLLDAVDLSPADARLYFQQMRAIVGDRAQRRGLKLELEVRSGKDVAGAVMAEAAVQQPELILLGGARSLFSSDLLAGANREILRSAPCPVGVLVDRGRDPISSVLVLRERGEDYRLMEFFATAAARGKLECTAALVGSPVQPAIRLPRRLQGIAIAPLRDIDADYLDQFDLVAMDSLLFRRMAHSPSTSLLVVQFPGE